ncbi:MAG: glycosyltransferase family 9 protein [Verrucomicrobiae bacterium]|nr:glycosyltransferase family 9 protein [Verrucomicrobiae bacterium]MCX7722288.1 glycosyltransferase family 9 protein [Verrucomicrobiae bacterium]
MSAKRGKVLVIRGGAIGDFILTLPAIAALRARFQDAHLELLGYPHIAQLAAAGGLVDCVKPIEARGLASFFVRGGQLPDEWKDYFSEFDLIVSYLYDPDGIFSENVGRCSFALFVQGPHRPSETDKEHATNVFLKPLERLGIFNASNIPRLALPRTMRTAKATLAVHPGSGSERKNWPERKWVELLQQLVRKPGLQVLMVGGEAEADRLDRLVTALPPDRVELARSLPLVALGTLLQECVAFVGHDSGITHLAAALGVPCVVLWGDTAPEVWQPLGPEVTILRSELGLAALEIASVQAELDRVLSRRAMPG